MPRCALLPALLVTCTGPVPEDLTPPPDGVVAGDEAGRFACVVVPASACVPVVEGTRGLLWADDGLVAGTVVHANAGRATLRLDEPLGFLGEAAFSVPEGRLGPPCLEGGVVTEAILGVPAGFHAMFKATYGRCP